MPRNLVPIPDVETLIRVLREGDGCSEFYIQLNHGACSSKRISYDEKSCLFHVVNLIDGSRQWLNVDEITNEQLTHIGPAIKAGAFYLKGN